MGEGWGGNGDVSWQVLNTVLIPTSVDHKSKHSHFCTYDQSEVLTRLYNVYFSSVHSMKINFDSSRQRFVSFHCNMFCNDWAPFCTRNVFLKSVYKGQTKRKWSLFSMWSGQNTVSVCEAVTVSVHVVTNCKNTKSELRKSYPKTEYINVWQIPFCFK